VVDVNESVGLRAVFSPERKLTDAALRTVRFNTCPSGFGIAFEAVDFNPPHISFAVGHPRLYLFCKPKLVLAGLMAR